MVAVSGATDGELWHDPTDGFIEEQDAFVSLVDLIAEAMQKLSHCKLLNSKSTMLGKFTTSCEWCRLSHCFARSISGQRLCTVSQNLAEWSGIARCTASCVTR